ncbi:MAG: IPT/TIG domain-containing protein, partial [Anaerolineae bacterium]|nr:IPT/TIG domain-containing protein [Anaerolineae bacterium]
LTLTVRGRDFVAGAQVTWDGVAQTTEVLSATEVQALIAAELVLGPGAVNIRVVNPGPGGGTSAPLTFTVRPVAGPVEYAIYLPLVQFNPEEEVVELPDLVVKSVLVRGWDVEVVIENQGSGSVLAEDVFWVDLYVKPSPPPSGVNDTWSDGRCSQGIVWGVSGEVLPLEPGETLRLTLGDDYYWGVYSNFNGNLPAGVPIYVQVDSANLQSNYGSVLETHEESGEPYNNILGPVDSLAPAAVYDYHPRLSPSPHHQLNLPPRR